MPADFAYDGSKIVVCNGTEGTPKTFANMHDADMAGSFELLAATACTTNMTLTNQIQPAEQLGLQISFILSGTSAGAGDTLDITGTDHLGNAQNESIDVSGGDGTYNGDKYWRTITDIDCTGWADGTLQVTQPRWGVVWEVIENGFYKIDCDVDIGDNSTSTYFQTKNESIYFANDKMLSCTGTGAHLTFGELVSDVPQNGSRLDIGPDGISNYLSSSSSSTLKIYASHIHCRTDIKMWMRGNALDIRETILSMYTGNLYRGFIFSNCGSGNLDNVYIVRTLYAMILLASPTMTNVRIGKANRGVASSANGVIATGVKFTDTTYDVATEPGPFNLTLKDPVTSISTIQIGAEVGWVKEQYTCNIHVADKDGNDLSGVTVVCKDKNDNQIFSVQTDGSGDIAEQIIDYKKWEGTSETLTEYSPHKFIFTKAGQRTIEIKNVTVDSPIVWGVEMSGANRALVGGAT